MSLPIMMMLCKAVVLWLLLAVLAILNGSLREFVLNPLLGTSLALPLSGVLFSVLVLLTAYLGMPYIGPQPAMRFWLIGGFWLLLTLAFEFLFGHYLGAKSWSELFAAYDPRGGNLWLLILIVTACAPYLAARWRGLTI